MWRTLVRHIWVIISNSIAMFSQGDSLAWVNIFSILVHVSIIWHLVKRCLCITWLTGVYGGYNHDITKPYSEVFFLVTGGPAWSWMTSFPRRLSGWIFVPRKAADVEKSCTCCNPAVDVDLYIHIYIYIINMYMYIYIYIIYIHYIYMCVCTCVILQFTIVTEA